MFHFMFIFFLNESQNMLQNLSQKELQISLCFLNAENIKQKETSLKTVRYEVQTIWTQIFC